MGWSGDREIKHGPCTNCGRPQGGFMLGDWRHEYWCCSDRCGRRLGHRIKYGFKPGLELKLDWAWWDDSYSFPRKPSPQRIEIKRLRHRLKRARLDVEGFEKTFRLRWDADMRAIKRWQAAAPGRELTWPDHADMVVWMLETQDAIAQELALLADSFELGEVGDPDQAAVALRNVLSRHGLLKEKTS